MQPESAPVPRPYGTARTIMLGVAVVFYGAAGIVHLASPDAFLPIVPDRVPEPRAVVLATGACEVAGALGVLTRPIRRLAGIMLALYAVCVYPANVKHAMENVDVPQLPRSWWYHGPRLLAQPVVVWWALFCTGVVTWPFGRNGSRGLEQQDRGRQPVQNG